MAATAIAPSATATPIFSGLKSVTFNFETIQGKIYVAGISSRPDLLSDMISALKNIKGVSEIVNYVIIKEKD